jgi:hypothetical protein
MVYGWCAWDTLFITKILGKETHVESADPLTGETVRLTVTLEALQEVRPEGAVVSFLLPTGPFGADVVQSFCHFVHFFASRQSAQRWTADHPARSCCRWMRPSSSGGSPTGSEHPTPLAGERPFTDQDRPGPSWSRRAPSLSFGDVLIIL